MLRPTPGDPWGVEQHHWNTGAEENQQLNPIEDGSERIQFVELIVQPVPILLVSVYMPYRGSSDNTMEFTDCVDQLHSIVETYSSTHVVLIGGDINENLIECSENKRYTTFKDFMLENKISHTRLGKTFMNSAGEEVSSIGYFIYDEAVKNLNCTFEKMNLCVSSLSDHYPLQCSIHIELNCKQPVKTRECTSRIKWNKIDLNECKTVVSEKTHRQSRGDIVHRGSERSNQYC